MKKFINDLIILEIGKAITIIITLFTSVSIAKILKPQDFGIYTLAFSIYGLIGILGNWGVIPTTIVKFSEAYTRRDQEACKILLAFFLKMSILIGVVIFIFGFYISPYLGKLLYGNKEIGDLARLLFLIFPLVILYKFYLTILQATRRMTELVILENLSWVSVLILVVGLPLLGLGIKGAIYGWVIATLFSSFLAFAMYRKLNLEGIKLPSLIDITKMMWKSKVEPYFKFSLFVALSENMNLLYDILPITLLGMFVITKDVGYFKFAYGVVCLPVILWDSISRNLFSKLPESKGKNNLKELKEVFLKVSLYSGLTSILITIIILIILPLIIRLWMKEYIPSIKIIYILSIYFAFYGFWVGLSPIFRTLERLNVEIKLNFLGIILLVLLGSVLIRNIGITGAAIAIVIVGLLTKLSLYFKATKILEEVELL